MGVDVGEEGQLDCLPLGLDVHRLSPDHSLRPGGQGDFVDHGLEETWIEVADVCGIRQKGEGLGQERIPDQDGDGLAEDLMTRGATASEIIVVHGREVVVNQRVRMDVLEGAGDGQDIFRTPSHRLGGGDGQDRPQSLPACEEAIVHGLVQFNG